ncbi:hypothetical protein WJX75_001713 [Coccomyxa subellipsoidea]|uniref:WASH1 WAHD domain-containing protein n=1 Tax=Coccomyxa subellipsoidea TaxID=248742 RepID=A0ABR2Z2G3_9CHLO
MNIYVANTTQAVNEVAGVCERKVHDVDRRLRRISINMSLLEAQVDSAVASQQTPALVDASERTAAGSSSAQQADQVVEQPLSTAPSVSDGIEEIDVETPRPLRDDSKRRGLRADYKDLQEGPT